MRSLIGEVSASPLLSKWLGTENLARQIVALVEGAAGDGLPFRFLTPLRPTGEFSVVTRNGRTTIAPDSYARYDAMAGVIAAIDPATVVRVYRTLSPRLEEAHGELGEGERTFDQTLAREPAAARRDTHPRWPGRGHAARRLVRLCRSQARGAVAGAEAAAAQRPRQRAARADAAVGHRRGAGDVGRRARCADALGPSTPSGSRRRPRSRRRCCRATT